MLMKLYANPFTPDKKKSLALVNHNYDIKIMIYAMTY